jgi:FAD-dependent urate hydroxylase
VTAIPIEITSSRRGVMYVGPAGLCGLMPAGEGLLQWWFDRRWTPDSPLPASPVAMFKEHFGDWPEPVQAVLAAVGDDDVGFFPHYRHAVPRTWGTGCMTLVGDAAHSMPPTRAQGANQALEDAFALAAALRTGGDVADALRHYEHGRAPKAGLVAKQSGREDTNEYRPWMIRLLPDGLVSRYHTRWLGQISDYLS